jgi:hypothetical protein
MAKLVVLVAVLAALAYAPTAAAQARDNGNRAERGIVQSVGLRSLTMRTLDGAAMIVRVNAGTRVFVDQRRATLRDIRRGFVVLVKYGDVAAREIRAFNGGESAGPGQGGPPPGRGKQPTQPPPGRAHI